MRLLIFFTLLFPGFLCAQTPDSLKTKKWAIGLTYSPDFCYRINYTSRMSIYSGSGETEKPKAGMTAGVNFLYQLLDRVGIETGILYSTKGEKVYSPSVNWIMPDGSTSDPSVPNNTSASYKAAERKSTYTYKYLEVPLKINWYAVNNKFKVYPNLGVSANIFLGKKTVSDYHFDEGGSEKTSSAAYDAKNIPALDMAVLVGVGLSYDVSKNLFIKAEPAYRQFVRPLVDRPISGRFYSFGLNAGVYFRI